MTNMITNTSKPVFNFSAEKNINVKFGLYGLIEIRLWNPRKDGTWVDGTINSECVKLETDENSKTSKKAIKFSKWGLHGFNASVDGVEETILQFAKAGFDIESETAKEAIVKSIKGVEDFLCDEESE